MNLLPCPFCGGNVDIKSIARYWYRIEGDHKEGCIFEDAEMFEVPQTDEQKDLLIRDWNRRAAPEPLTDEQVCEIAKPFVAVIGGHWENDYGIHERSVEDFARAIEKAHGIGAGE